MDDAKLKKIVENIETPASDSNAKKIAVNMAVSEFQAHQKEKEKKSQGFPILSRLIGKDEQKRRETMDSKFKKKLFYGSAMTALGVTLLAGPMLMEASMNTIGSGNSAIETPKGQDFLATKQDSRITVATAPKEKKREEVRQLAEQEADIPEQVAMVDALAVVQEEIAPAPASAPAKMMSKTVSADKNVVARTRMASPQTLGVAQGVVASSVIASPDIVAPTYKEEGRDKFEEFDVNPIKLVSEAPVSTFSVDVDTASYSFMRRQINNGVLPQKDAVRVEELINYFDYDYAVPENKAQPFKPTVTITDSPWAEEKKLMHIGIKGYEITDEQPNSNLVFLLDTSGSMNSPDKLPLVKNSLKLMLDQMDENDTISIVVYAGSAGTVLEPTKASEKSKIIAALDRLNAGGSTAGAAGIKLAYQLAEENFDKDSVNRVILATDGDFNVGITKHEELKDFVERKRGTGIFLSVLGFGQGNYNDQMMQTLAQNGNGVAAYIDNLNEARKVLVEEASSTLFPIAKDVKIQVEFNKTSVSEYRLIGYETRALKREDFNNDKIDAGDIGAGHTVTAIYEITPADAKPSVDPLRYGQAEEQKEVKSDFSDEYAFLKIRYKLPDENTSKLITTPITKSNDPSFTSFCVAHPCEVPANEDTRFATAVAGFGQLLQGGQYTASFSYDDVIELAQGAKGADPFGYRAEFINLVRLAKSARGM